MRIEESFEVDEGVDAVWGFFNTPERVAECVPGVDAIDVVSDDEVKVEVTQSVGPLNATFALKLLITERVDGESMKFTAVGQAVRGAVGSVRSTNEVHIEPAGGKTRVSVVADLAMGGMLGSVGQKVVAKQSRAVVEQFAVALGRVLRGEKPYPAAADPGKGEAAASAATRSPGVGQWIPGGGSTPVLHAAVILLAYLLGRSSGRNAAYAQTLKWGRSR